VRVTADGGVTVAGAASNGGAPDACGRTATGVRAIPVAFADGAFAPAAVCCIAKIGFALGAPELQPELSTTNADTAARNRTMGACRHRRESPPSENIAKGMKKKACTTFTTSAGFTGL
jgi:hypothetical protein